MKIAYLAGANSIHSVRWIEFFVEKGHEIIWISFAPPAPEAKELVKKTKFHEITPSLLSDINGPFAIRHLSGTVKKVKEILDREKPDLLHVHSAGTYGLVAALAGFHPTILTPWGSDILLGGFIRKLLLIFIVGRTDIFTCDGENTFERLIGLGAERDKISLVRFGTDIEKFRPEPKTNQSKIKIISLRTLLPVYDIESLIRAAAIVTKSAPNAEFIIAGGGDDRERLEKLTKDLDIEKIVGFVGRVENQELPKFLQSADIYVSTSLSDSGLASSTAEAMATELPVVVTESGDNKEWIDPPAGGFVVAVKSPEQLAERIITLIKDAGMRKTQGARNRKIIEEKNNYRVEMEKIEKVYENLVSRK